MEPTSSPDNHRPAPGLARFWQVRPAEDGPDGPPAPAPSSDPFGLGRSAPHSGTPAGSRHGDTDHSVPPDEETGPDQDVKSQEPFGGFGLGSRLGGTGRFLFGSRGAAAEPPDSSEPAARNEPAGATGNEAATGATENEAAHVADRPDGEPPSGATPAETSPQEETPPEADDEDTATAGPSDENGREDMNGRAGSPGYAQTGEAPGPDGTAVPVQPGRNGDTGDEAPAPPEQGRPAAGWAQMPTSMVPMTNGPVSGPPTTYGGTDFTPDHPAGAVTPMSGQPAPAAAAPEQSAQPPQVPSVQIPATRTPPDLTPETPENGTYGFGPAGYSLGRSGEAFGVASVAPTSPPGTVTPPPAEFSVFPPSTLEVGVTGLDVGGAGVTGLAVGGAGRRAREETAEETQTAPRRSASLEDVEPVRRAGRRAAAREEEQPAPALADPLGGTEEALITRTVWDEDAARHFRAAWHEVKAEFVDDPVTALTRAHDLLTDAVNELTEVLLAERDELDPLRGTGTPDTESMRMAMRGYREFLDRILSL